MSPRLNGHFVSAEIAGAGSAGLQSFGTLDLRRNRGHNGLRHFLLHREDVLQHPVVALRPDVIAGQRVDQLAGDTDPVRRPADAALQYIANAEVPTDLPDVRRLALVGE